MSEGRLQASWCSEEMLLVVAAVKGGYVGGIRVGKVVARLEVG